jgi:hypothetical protein
MSSRFVRAILGISVLTGMFAIGREGSCWEPRCFVTPSGLVPSIRPQVVELERYRKCAPDEELATGYYRGEHYRLCYESLATLRPQIDARSMEALQRELFDTELFDSGKEWDRRRLSSGSRPQLSTDLRAGTKHTYCELAELADSSKSLMDWLGGLPPSACRQSPCRTFGKLGPLNSNHFGEQAGATYLAYHAKAMAAADQCRRGHTLVVDFRRRFGGVGPDPDDYFRRCARTAFAFEGYGQHYLQDRWAIGHMWNRWGAPRLDAFPSEGKAATVSVAAGIVHGAEAMTGQPDGLGSAHPAASWGRLGSEDRFHGVGDLEAERLMTDGDFRMQRDWLLGCTAAGVAEVARFPGWEQVRGKYPLDACTGGGWATNASLAAAFDLELGSVRLTPEQLAGASAAYDIPLKLFLNGMQQVNVDVRKLGAELVPVVARVRALATVSPTGLEAAQSKLPDFLGMHHGGAYLAEASAFTTIGDVNVPTDYAEPVQHGTATAALLGAVWPTSCQLLTPTATKDFVAECQATKSAASCSLCQRVLESTLTVDGALSSDCQIFLGRSGDKRFGLTVARDVCANADPGCPNDPLHCAREPFQAPTDAASMTKARSSIRDLARSICESGIAEKRQRGACEPSH